MMKKLALILCFFCLFGCTKKVCEADTDCVYGDEIGSFCVHISEGGYDERIYDRPECACIESECVLRGCGDPPCYYG